MDCATRPIDALKAARVVLAAKGVEAGYLIVTKQSLARCSLDLTGQLLDDIWRQGILASSPRASGAHPAMRISVRFIGGASLFEVEALLHATNLPTENSRIELPGLSEYVESGSVLAFFAHRGVINVANVSDPAVLESVDDPASPLARLLDKLSCASEAPFEDQFTTWNLRLLKSFFTEASEDREVFLRVDQDVLDEIGQDIGGDAGFISAVRAGPRSCKRSESFVARNLALVTQRERIEFLRIAGPYEPEKFSKINHSGYVDPGQLDPSYQWKAAPAYLPYLAMLVRIARVDASGGFHSNLRETLCLQEPFGSNQLAQLEAVWKDLEKWTANQNGKFGIFRLRRLGGYVHIGVPLAQSILKPADIKCMPTVFRGAGIRPDSDFDDKAIATVLKEARALATARSSFSASFQAALGNTSFDAPISSILRAIYQDWDGGVPHKSPQESLRSEEVSGNVGIGLCLSLVREEPLEFEAHWSLPPIHDSGGFELKYGANSWHGFFLGPDGGTTGAIDALQTESWRLAEEAFSGEVKFELCSYLGDESEQISQEVSLAKHLLWVMVPAASGPLGRLCLREGQLPAYGVAFLLAPPGSTGRLEGYLERLKPDHDLVEASGIPDGWMLVRLRECSKLNDEQRALPDGAEVHRSPRLIRFVGGRLVRRGYGQMYLPYDLPTLEFDAPEGAVLTFSEGVEAVEEHGAFETGPNVASMFRPTRRYKLKLRNSGSASYQFQALYEGREVGRPAYLRIAGAGGDLVEAGDDLSLDQLGAGQSSAGGLAGVLATTISPESATREPAQLMAIHPRELGWPCDGDSVEWGVEEKFLDALAQSGAGAMDAGIARRLISRLLADVGRDGNPTLMLVELRSRGHIELAVTHKGQLARVHAVQPIIARLPVSASGKAVYGILGTLRLSHWDALASECSEWKTYVRRSRNSGFMSMTILEEHCGAVQSGLVATGKLGKRGFRLSSFPSEAIAEWSADLHVVREAALRNPMESIGRANEGAMCFNASKGRFSAMPSRRPLELWKTVDLDTGLGQVHYLVRSDQTTNELEHSFVRDSRWGVWIALEAFSGHIKQTCGWEDVHPFPLCYQESTSTIWLPARIGLPVVLERALILCAGASPDVWMLQGAPASTDGNGLALYCGEEEAPRVRVSRQYHEMADGKWLAYRWVPITVATTVACKLGARLDVV